MHCLDLVEWKNNNKSQILNKLLELKMSNKFSTLNKNLKNLFNSLEYNNKEVSNTQGNDPLRVFSSIIDSSQKDKEGYLPELDTK